jgi:hypothetical protein
MSEQDPWEQAAECDRTAKCQTDPEYVTVYNRLRDLWIALANERSSLTETEFQKCVGIIGLAQDCIISKTATKH